MRMPRIWRKKEKERVDNKNKWVWGYTSWKRQTRRLHFTEDGKGTYCGHIMTLISWAFNDIDLRAMGKGRCKACLKEREIRSRHEKLSGKDDSGV